MRDREATKKTVERLRQFAEQTARGNRDNLQAVYPTLRLLNQWALQIQMAMKGLDHN